MAKDENKVRDFVYIRLSQKDLDKLGVEAKVEDGIRKVEPKFREEYDLEARKSARVGVVKTLAKELGLPEDTKHSDILKAAAEKLKKIKSK